MATYTYVDNGGAGDLSDPSSYSPAGTPGPGDTVVIDLVNILGVEPLTGTCNAGTVELNGGTIINGGTFNGNVALEGEAYGGTFNGDVSGLSGSVILGGTFNGAVDFGGSEINGGTFNGPLSVPAIGSVYISGNPAINDRWSIDGGTTWLYASDSPEIAAPSDVRAGASNAGTPGALDLPAEADVRAGVQYDGASKTGTLTAAQLRSVPLNHGNFLRA